VTSSLRLLILKWTPPRTSGTRFESTGRMVLTQCTMISTTNLAPMGQERTSLGTDSDVRIYFFDPAEYPRLSF